MSEFEGKRTLGKTSRRWDGNNKTELKEKKWKGVDWIDLARDMNKVKGNEHSYCIKCEKFC